VTPFRRRKVKHLSAWGKFGAAQLVCFVEMLTSLLDDYDLQAESCGWLFKSPLAGVGGILWRPHYRPHSLLLYPLPQ